MTCSVWAPVALPSGRFAFSSGVEYSLRPFVDSEKLLFPLISAPPTLKA